MKTLRFPDKKGALAFVRNRIKGSSRYFKLSTHVDGYSGYNYLGVNLYKVMRSLGYAVDLVPTNDTSVCGHVPSDLLSECKKESDASWELLLHPPNYPYDPTSARVWFTMYECSGVRNSLIDRLNRSTALVVPTAYSADSFSSSGVAVPIHVVPLGIDTEVFSYRENNYEGKCVFGVAGRLAHGGYRKGLNESIEAFLQAFPTEKDVQLKVKCFEDCDIAVYNDPRIEYHQGFFTEKQEREWLYSLNWFVSASTGEGWGYWHHKAMSCGRPLISVKYGGVAEFFNDLCGLPIKFDYVKAAGYYTPDDGYWAYPRRDSLVECYRTAYGNEQAAKSLGFNAAQSASIFDFRNTCRQLDNVLCELGLAEKI